MTRRTGSAEEQTKQTMYYVTRHIANLAHIAEREARWGHTIDISRVKIALTNLEARFFPNGVPKDVETTEEDFRGEAPSPDEISDLLKDELQKLKVATATVVTEELKRIEKPQIDLDFVRREIAVEVAKNVKPTSIEIKTERATVKIDGAHHQFERLVKLLGSGMSVYLWGPAGSGKTTAAMQAAIALGLEAEIDTLDQSTFRSMIQGYMTPQGEPVHTTFSRCWTSGKIYIADECDNAPGHVQTLFNSALANGVCPLAWGNAKRADGAQFVATGNTPFRPTREFPDRRPGSAAFVDRLYFMYWPIDPTIECRAMGMVAPRIETAPHRTCTPQVWGTFVQNLRRWASVSMPTLMVTPRATFEGARAMQLGESVDQVMDGLIFRGCDQEMRNKALQSVRLEAA